MVLIPNEDLIGNKHHAARILIDPSPHEFRQLPQCERNSSLRKADELWYLQMSMDGMGWYVSETQIDLA
jgi:hypothetical protein